MKLDLLQSQLGEFIDPPIILSTAEGVYVRTLDGRSLIDLCSGYWLVCLGYRHPEVIRTMSHAAKELSYAHLFRFAHESAILLAEKLISLTGHSGFKKVLYANSGSGAMEIALHLGARYAKVRRIEDPRFVYLRRGYHGSSFLEQQITTYSHYPQSVRLESQFSDLPSPMNENLAEQTVSDFRTLAFKGNVVAFVSEPIQGIGGVVVPPAWFFPEIRRICDEHDILLIFDEVSTGIGATGNWFGFQHVGAIPDIMAIGKRLAGGYFPISAVLANQKLTPVFGEGFDHGHATSGHPIGCKVALKVLEIIERDELIPKVRNLGERFASILAQKFSPIFGEESISTIGFMFGIRTAKSDLASTIQRAAIDRGVLLIPEGRYLILFPPFVITEEQFASAIDKLQQACLEVAPSYQL
jgi:adenosylmethionine-8-amino-7-oxononanoate aminotransferase